MKVGTDPRLPTSADIGQLKTRLYDVFRQYGVAHNQLVLAHRELEAFATGTPSSFRNRLYNGNFAINQRGYVSGTATTAANQYTLDRWRVVTLGQSVTFAASGNGNQITAPAGGYEQVIEGANIEGGVYTLSWVGTATATVNGAAIANGGQTAALPANTDVTIRLSGGTVKEAQFEVSSTATAFEQRPAGLELLLCCRYAYQPDAVPPVVMALDGGAVLFHFPTPMRVVPIVIENGYTAANYSGSGAGPALGQWAITASGVAYVSTVSGSMITVPSATKTQGAITFYGSTFNRIGWQVSGVAKPPLFDAEIY